jgi:hypothetical protein
MSSTVPNCSLSLAGEYALVRRRNRSDPQTARILGREVNGGVETIYLDALVHRPEESEISGWQTGGAISTILTRVLASVPENHAIEATPNR